MLGASGGVGLFLLQLAAAARIWTIVSHVLPLGAAAEAHRILEGGHAGGKIVLDVASS